MPMKCRLLRLFHGLAAMCFRQGSVTADIFRYQAANKLLQVTQNAAYHYYKLA